ncbi:MAG: DMT family transporter [Gammaproteobacteria bacterium]|nr:DMT family transporter [Gammaproteobacteria bacterium]
MQNLPHYRSGVVFSLLTAVCLGSITTQAKLYYDAGGNAMTLMLVRFFVSTLVFGLFIFLRSQPFRVNRSERAGVTLIGCVWSASMICYLLSVETISVSLAVLVLYTYPLLVLLFAIISRQLAPSIRLSIMFLAAFAGLYLALFSGDIKLNSTGMVFVMLASLGAAYTFVKGAHVAPLMNPLLMTFWVNLIGLVMILPMIYSNLVIDLPPSAWVALAVATILYVIAIFSQFQALARLPATTAALILNLEPVVSILFAMLVLGEQLVPEQWFGVIIVITVLIASVLINKTQKSS